MALQLQSAGEGPVLEEPLGVVRGKAGYISLLPEHFGFTALSRPARPIGKWHSLCMSRICLRRGERVGLEIMTKTVIQPGSKQL